LRSDEVFLTPELSGTVKGTWPNIILKYYSLYMMTNDEDKWAMRAASVTG
jgi:hypothetical protein